MSISALRKVVLAKLETTYGTDAVPTGASDAVLVRSVNPSKPLDAKTVDRPQIRPFFGQLQQLVSGLFSTIEIEMELAGFGTAGPAAPTPAYDALLQCCGLSRTVTAGTSVVYAPVSTGIPSCTIYYYLDGTVFKLTGCRGDLEASLKVGEIPTLKFTMTGLYAGVVDAALPAQTLSAYVTPVLVNSTNTAALSLFGSAAAMSSFDFKLGNSLETRELPGSVRQVLLTDRKPQASIECEYTTVAGFDWWGKIADATLGAFSVQHGTSVGNKVTVAGQDTQITNNARLNESQNIVHLQTDLRFLPSAAGNDELTITVA